MLGSTLPVHAHARNPSTSKVLVLAVLVCRFAVSLDSKVRISSEVVCMAQCAMIWCAWLGVYGSVWMI